MTRTYETKEDIIDACNRVLRGAPKEFPPDLPRTKDLMGAPAWYPFEHTAWSIGESIRVSLAKNRKLINDDDILSRLLEVIKTVNLRRGRESFVMALGFRGAAKVATDLAPFINDSDIGGHVVGTLLKMKASGFRKEVAYLASSKRPWVRNKAKQYILRYPEDGEQRHAADGAPRRQ